MQSLLKKLFWLTLFSIAMGFMETSVVVYLRKIYYPDGFRFPLVPLDSEIGLVELFREAATIIMLLGIGILTGKTASQRFAFFIFCFAIWDLFYYIFLWLLIGWPESLLTWDILFLIPVPWVGPVITPCIVSITMVLLAAVIIGFQNGKTNTKLSWKEWLLFISGSLVIILSFIWDYILYSSGTTISENPFLITELQLTLNQMLHYIPVEFNWPLFITGELITLFGIILYAKRLYDNVRFEKSKGYTQPIRDSSLTLKY